MKKTLTDSKAAGQEKEERRRHPALTERFLRLSSAAVACFGPVVLLAAHTGFQHIFLGSPQVSDSTRWNGEPKERSGSYLSPSFFAASAVSVPAVATHPACPSRSERPEINRAFKDLVSFLSYRLFTARLA